MYQTFHVVSWGQPSRDFVKNERFPLAVHKASDSISVAYRWGRIFVKINVLSLDPLTTK